MTAAAEEQAGPEVAPCYVCGVATARSVTIRQNAVAGPRGGTAAQWYGICDECASLDPDSAGVALRAAFRAVGKDTRAATWAGASEAFEEASAERGRDTLRWVVYANWNSAEPQRKPWAHVPADDRRAIKAVYVRLLRRQVERPIERPTPAEAQAEAPTTPPVGMPRACVACGAARSVDWYEVTTGALTRGPGYITGCVCDACGPVLRGVGAVGAPFLEKAVMEAKGLAFTPRPVWPWVATGLPPQREPWSWVDVTPPVPTDPLEALRVRVAALEARLLETEAAR